MIVNQDRHPAIVRAFHLITQDNNPTGLTFPFYVVPDHYESAIDTIEKTIAALSEEKRAPESPPLPSHMKPNTLIDSELYTFCNGEYEEMGAIASRTPELALASAFLTDYFEGWENSVQAGLVKPIEYLGTQPPHPAAPAEDAQ